jgi:hypothetical protein
MQETEDQNKESPKDHQNKILKAYRAVFGQDGKRTEAQRIVIADIESQGGIWRNAWIPTDKGDLDPYRSAIAEGKRIFAIRQIQMANSRPGEAKKEVTVTKG